jgi:hypothetical protein
MPLCGSYDYLLRVVGAVAIQKGSDVEILQIL